MLTPFTFTLQLLTRGKGCYTCGVRMHTHCFSKYRATKVKCPQCGSDWASHESAAKLVEIGEKAAGGDGDHNTRRSKKRASTEEESDEDRKRSQTQEDDEEEEPTQTQTQTQTQRKSRRSNPRRGRCVSSLPLVLSVLLLASGPDKLRVAHRSPSRTLIWMLTRKRKKPRHLLHRDEVTGDADENSLY